MMIATEARWVRLAGATNVRDLGGYSTRDGITKWGTVFRADSLHALSVSEQQVLIERGVRTVIDLRHAGETDAQPNVYRSSTDVHYFNIPIFRGAPPVPNPGQVPDLPTIYRYIVDDCRSSLADAFTVIADAPAGGLLFHCSAGKDRTGVIAALLLGLAGVPKATIAEDYALTEQAMQYLRPRLLAQTAAAGGDPARLERLLSCYPEDMLRFLTYLDEWYGGAARYLRDLGLSAAQLERLRDRLVDFYEVEIGD
jgi:protein-tyrosine phosphatase